MSDPVTAYTTMTLFDFLIGIAGNLFARHVDPTANPLAAEIFGRLSQGGPDLPPNHDVARACRDSLRQALIMLAKSMELQITRPKTFFEAFHNRHDSQGRWKPLIEWKTTDEGDWFDAFVREIQDDKALALFQIPVAGAASLGHAVRNLADDALDRAFREGLREWTQRRVQTGCPPDCFNSCLETGWPVNEGSTGVRITLYQAWSLFMQHQIKKSPEVFHILTVEWLATIDAKLETHGLTDELIQRLQEPLKAQHETLVTLCDSMDALLDDVGDLSTQLGDLLLVVTTFQWETGENFANLRVLLVDLRGQLNEVQSSTRRLEAGQDQIQSGVRRLLERGEIPTAARVPRRELPPEAATVLYGRKKQQNQLRNALKDAKNTAVVGAAGYGKTALAAKVIREVIGASDPSLAESPFRDGVLYLNLYAHHGQAESVWNELASKLRGDDFEASRPAQERATAACRHLRILVIVEGAEEADGTDDRPDLETLLSVLASENCRLVLTREKLQSVGYVTVSLDDPLAKDEAGWLFDALTRHRVTGSVRDRILTLLDGHPLALTWAGNLLALEVEDPSELATAWEADPTLHLKDPTQTRHTLRWLFERSVRGLEPTARQVLDAAGLLAPIPFEVSSMIAAIGNDSATDAASQSAEIREALQRLIRRGLLRTIKRNEGFREFTHVLAYHFARNEVSSDNGLRNRLAVWLHQQLARSLKAGTAPTADLDDLLKHAAALVRTDHDQQLWIPLVNFLLYDAQDRLNDLGRLASVSSVLTMVAEWLDGLRGIRADESDWQRERTACFSFRGNLAIALGNLSEAERLFREALGIAQRLSSSDPDNSGWQRDLSVALSKLGDLAIAQGNLSEVERLFGEDLGIAQRLAASDPDNSGWQRDLSVSFNKLGDLAIAQGNLSEAERLFGEALRTRQRLASSDPDNSGWQRDLSVSFEKLGDLAIAQGNLSEAERLFGESLRTRQRLAASDPDNSGWQRDLWVSYWRVADVREKLGLPDADVAWRNAHATLAAMVSKGVFVSDGDLRFLEQLRAKLGVVE